MNLQIPEKIEKLKSINVMKYQIGVRKDIIDLFKKALKKYKPEEKEAIDDLTDEISKYENEISYLNEKISTKLSLSKRIKRNYKIIDVPASGIRNWSNGARTMCFVYSKYHGNFILRGYLGEVLEYLKKNYTHYFYYQSMWSRGCSRGYWQFWKDNVSIHEPSKNRKVWKYGVVKYSKGGFFDRKELISLKFKRMPKQWIKEFDEL